MKKGIILSAIALCLLALPGKAQEPVRSVEFEMGFGSGAAIWLGKSCASLEFKMELRCGTAVQSTSSPLGFGHVFRCCRSGRWHTIR